jgi:stage V sporulation protein B
VSEASPTSEQAAAHAAEKRHETARTAGRGGLAIAGAKVSFIVFGFIQQPILAALLGEVGYGEVSRILTIVGIVNNVIVATAIQGVSHAVSSVPEDKSAEAFARSLKIQVTLAMVVSALFALFAGLIADWVAAPEITTPLRLVAGVTLFYGIYAPLIGSLNGRRKFVAQAGLDTSYGILRTGCMAVGALVAGVTGSILGFVACAAIIIPAALVFSGVGKRGPAGPTAREYLSFVAPLAFGQIALNLLMQTDFLLLSRYLGDAAPTADEASRAIASYRAVKLFALLPYQMLISVVFVLFPMLARAHAEGNKKDVAHYTQTGLRLALVLTGLMAGTICAISPLALRFAYAAEYADQGDTALRVGALGMGAFGMFGVMQAALTSLKRERIAAILTVTAVVLVGVSCTIAVPRADFGEPMLVVTSVATSVAMLLTVIAGAFFLRQAAHALVPPLTLVRVGIAVVVAYAVGTRLPYLGKLVVLVEALAVGLVYLGVLVVTRELGRADLDVVKRALGRKKA